MRATVDSQLEYLGFINMPQIPPNLAKIILYLSPQLLIHIFGELSQIEIEIEIKPLLEINSKKTGQEKEKCISLFLSRF